MKFNQIFKLTISDQNFCDLRHYKKYGAKDENKDVVKPSPLTTDDRPTMVIKLIHRNVVVKLKDFFGSNSLLL